MFRTATIFQSLIPSGTCDFFDLKKNPTLPSFELFPTETWDFLYFLTTHPSPYLDQFPSFPTFSIGKLPLRNHPDVVGSIKKDHPGSSSFIG